MKLLLLLATVVTAGFGADDAAFARALQQAQSGNCEAAVSTLSAALRARPMAGRDHYRLMADCQVQLGDREAGIASLRAGLKRFPATALMEKRLGQLLFAQNPESVEAGKLLARVAAALPRDPEARHYYAQWAYLNLRDRVCVAQEQAGLRLAGLNDAALLQMNTMLGMCAARLEEAGVAGRAFAAAHQVNKQARDFDAVAAYQYLQFLTRFGDDRAAQALIDDVLERLPGFGPALLERAKLFERNKEPARAIDAARQALAGTNNDINNERAAHALLARCYQLLGQTAEAEAEEAWIAAHPNPEAPKR